jgi:dipeptidyl aminopeptidase/acylaminoacyl peptidase
MPLWLGWIAALAALAVAGYLATAAWMAWYVIRPDRSWRPAEYQPPQSPFETVTFQAADGVPIAGWYSPPSPELSGEGAHCVILCHGLGTNRTELQDIALELRRRGYGVLLFDFRGHGESGGSCTTVGLREVNDILGAVEFLCMRPEVDLDRIGILGVSMGGAAAIMAAAICPTLRWVVADCPFATLEQALQTAFEAFVRAPGWLFARPVIAFAQLFTGAHVTDVKPVECIGAIAPRPVLLIHGYDDGLVHAANSEQLYRAAGEPKELWLIPECDHVQCRVVAGEEYYRRVDAFFHRPVPVQLGQFSTPSVQPV